MILLLSSEKKFTLKVIGKECLLIEFQNIICYETSQKLQQLHSYFKQESNRPIIDIIISYTSMALCFKSYINSKTIYAIQEEVQTILNREIKEQEQTRTIEVPVCYDPIFGYDLATISENKKISMEELITIHCSKSYRVFMFGFLPGFAYMGKVDERIKFPRKLTPRFNIEPGSVGIADSQTGIYPLKSPGGWNIIGRTPIKLFSKNRAEPFYFNLNDEVRFKKIDLSRFKQIEDEYKST